MERNDGHAPVSGARKSGRGRRGVPRYGAMADINMTPFIDVMLVLLDHLHGRRAPADHRRLRRSAEDERDARSMSTTSRSPSRSTRRASSILMDQPIDRRRSSIRVRSQRAKSESGAVRHLRA